MPPADAKVVDQAGEEGRGSHEFAAADVHAAVAARQGNIIRIKTPDGAIPGKAGAVAAVVGNNRV